MFGFCTICLFHIPNKLDVPLWGLCIKNKLFGIVYQNQVAWCKRFFSRVFNTSSLGLVYQIQVFWSVVGCNLFGILY